MSLRHHECVLLLALVFVIARQQATAQVGCTLGPWCAARACAPAEPPQTSDLSVATSRAV